MSRLPITSICVYPDRHKTTDDFFEPTIFKEGRAAFWARASWWNLPPDDRMELFDTRLLLLAFAAAIGYGLATIGLKLASSQWSILAGITVVIGFYTATHCEILLMRGMELGVLYLLIIALETLIVLGYAFTIGEGLSLRESAGAVLIFAGIAVVLE